MPLRFGRQDCPGGPTSTAQNAFPNAKLGLDHAVSFFGSVFGLTKAEYVALIGKQRVVNSAQCYSHQHGKGFVKFNFLWFRCPHTWQGQAK